jgi:chromosome segregation ATPase
MTTITEADLKELKDLINSRFDRVYEELSSLKVGVAEIKVDINNINKRLDDTNTNLNKRLDDTNANLNKRLDDTNSQITQIQTKINGQTNWFIGIFSILVTGLLGIFGKIAFFPNL